MEAIPVICRQIGFICLFVCFLASVAGSLNLLFFESGASKEHVSKAGAVPIYLFICLVLRV